MKPADPNWIAPVHPWITLKEQGCSGVGTPVILAPLQLACVSDHLMVAR